MSLSSVKENWIVLDVRCFYFAGDMKGAGCGNWEQLSVVSTAVCDKTTALFNSSSYCHVNNWGCFKWIHSRAVERASGLHSLKVTRPQNQVQQTERVPVKGRQPHHQTAHECVLTLHLHCLAVDAKKKQPQYPLPATAGHSPHLSQHSLLEDDESPC